MGARDLAYRRGSVKRSLRAAAWLLAAASVFSLPRAAAAVGEEEWQLAVAGGYVQLGAEGRQRPGAGARLEAQRGISDSWALRVEVGASWQAAAGSAPGPSWAALVGGGATYALDVLRVVPFVEAGVALAALGGGGLAGQTDLGVQLGGGGEYLLDRHWAVAAVARYACLPLRIGGRGSGVTGLLSVALRLGRTF